LNWLRAITLDFVPHGMFFSSTQTLTFRKRTGRPIHCNIAYELG